VLRATFALLRAHRGNHFVPWRGKLLAAELVAAMQRSYPGAVLRVVTVVSGALDPLHDAPPAAELHGADSDQVHLRLIDAAVAPFDQHAGNAAPAEVACERQPHRAPSHDHYWSLRIGHSPRRQLMLLFRTPYRLNMRIRDDSVNPVESYPSPYIQVQIVRAG